MSKALAVVFLALLSACGGLSGTAPPVATPVSEVTRTVEQDGKFLALIGPRRQHAEPFLGVPATNFYALRTMIDARTGETVHQLYVEDSYVGGRRRWNMAQDAQGGELRFVQISDNEITCDNGCSYAEEFAAAVPEPLLVASQSGLTVYFASASGLQKTIVVPGELIQKQLAAVAATRAPRPVAANILSPGPGSRL